MPAAFKNVAAKTMSLTRLIMATNNYHPTTTIRQRPLQKKTTTTKTTCIHIHNNNGFNVELYFWKKNNVFFL